MTSDRRASLIEALVEDVRPVRPVMSLRSAVGIVIGAWGGLLAVVLLTLDRPPGAHALGVDTVYAVSFLGLFGAGIGAALAALAASRPGRDRVERAGARAAAGALLATLGLGLVGAFLGAAQTPDVAAAADCFRSGLVLALVPVVLVAALVLRGYPLRPTRVAALALLGAGALGGTIVHLACSILEPGHWLAGHASVPLVAAAVGVLPLAGVLRRARR